MRKTPQRGAGAVALPRQGYSVRGCLAALLCTLLFSGCAITEPQVEPTGETRATYQCDDGNSVEMRFFPLQGVGVLVRPGQPMELQQVPAASGFRYSNGPHTVRGKGSELIIEIGRMAPIRCEGL